MIHTDIAYRIAQGLWLGLMAYSVLKLIQSVRADIHRERRNREHREAHDRWYADGGQ